MNYKQFLIIVFLIETIYSSNDEWLPKKNDKYRGEKFPVKYLSPESIVPAMTDLNHYLRNLKKTVRYFANAPNDTDANKALGLYYMKAILKRTLRDDIGILNNTHQRVIKNLINKAEYVLSHFIYMYKYEGWNDILYRITKLLGSDESQVYSIAQFNRNRLQKWIHSDEKINGFHKEIDEASLPKEKYIKLLVEMIHNTRNGNSDKCLSTISFHPEPKDLAKLQPCRHEPECRKLIHEVPTMSYGLSHRLLNIMARRHFRRCFVDSEAEDDSHMDMLCSHMYRETVYIARRGYFFRDLFLEHIALCGMFGYEEFHRRHWFKKATSWMDEEGCMYEDRNFIMDCSRIGGEKFLGRQEMQEMLVDKCQNHPMALLVVVLANGVRYTTASMIKYKTTPPKWYMPIK